MDSRRSTARRFLVAALVTLTGCTGPGITTVPRRHPPSTATTAGPRDGEHATESATCAAASSAFAALTDLAGHTDADAMQDAIAPTIEVLRRASADMPAELRAPIEAVVSVLLIRRAAGTVARTAAAAGGDDVVRAVDELVVELGHVLFSPYVLLGLGPDLAERCPERAPVLANAPTTDPVGRARELRDRLDDLGAGAIADDLVPPGMLDVTDRDMTVALSGLQDDYVRCGWATDATTYGDNNGCDALRDACDARDLLACNDLYWVTAPGSEYEEFGATCGGRTRFGGPGFAGFCEQLG